MKKLFLIIGIIAMITLVACNNQLKEETQQIEEANNIPPLPSTEEDNSYRFDEVIEHSTADDCWLVIDGRVYDVTDWVGPPPGGDAILEGCGEDATALYETRPMGSGTPHSNKARQLLDDYYIGDLE
jgi:cytochrome b involved in lipid metabolism